MKMMQGACFLPCSKRSRTRLAPTPTNISTKSEPEIEKNGTPASPAIALASSVLPVPGGPIISTPLGMRPPSFWNFFGSLRKAMISSISSFASSMPATSCERDLVLRLAEQLRAALAEAHRLAAARLELAHEQVEHAEEEDHRQDRHRRARPEGRAVFLLEGDGDAVLAEELLVGVSGPNVIFFVFELLFGSLTQKVYSRSLI
jgi:hypothetical protein